MENDPKEKQDPVPKEAVQIEKEESKKRFVSINDLTLNAVPDLKL